MTSEAELSLIIDTALQACSVGLYAHEPLSGTTHDLWSGSEPMERGHQERIGTMALECFKKTGKNPQAIRRVITTLGPGSFTGLRIGMAFAKGLAEGAGADLVGISGFSALAQSVMMEALPRPEGLLKVVIDGGRGQAFVQDFRALEGDAHPVNEPYVLEISKETPTTDLDFEGVLTGPGLGMVQAFYPKATVCPRSYPLISALAYLGLRAEAPFETKPLYMREADAKVSQKPVLVL